MNWRRLPCLGVAVLMCCTGLLSASAQFTNKATVIDLLVVYTAAAREGAGGIDAIRSQIQSGLLDANLVFQNSHVNARLRMVRATEVDYVESGSVSNDLERLRNPHDGFMDDVAFLRNQCAADLVCLVTETGNDWWFYGFQGPSSENAFSVIRRPYLSGGWYFPVALSFNFGCQLERPYADSVGAFPYAYGYSFSANGTLYSTVEAFAGQRLPFFSNPTLQFQGMAAGVPAGTPYAADNARVINQTAPIVAAFRGTAPTTIPPSISLTAPADGTNCPERQPINIVAAASDADGTVMRVDVYADDAWLGVATNSPFAFSWTNADMGPHSLKSVATDEHGATTVSDSVSITVRPENDNFDSRTLLTGSNVIVTASNVYATSEPGEPTPQGIVDGHSLWWSWMAPFTGMVEVNTLSSAVATILAIYTGETVSGLTPVTSDYFELGFMATKGVTYQIVVDNDFSGSVGNIVLNVCPPHPPNDDFSNRTLLTGTSLTVHGSTIKATKEQGEASTRWGYGGDSIWWSWTAPETGNLRLGVNSTNGISWMIAVNTGDAISNLTVVAAHSWDSSQLPAFFDVAVRKDTVYQIVAESSARFGGLLSDRTGDLDLSLKFSPPPPNDDFSNRIILSGSWISLTNSSVAATSEPGEPGDGNSIWWSWTAPFSGHVTLSSASGHSLNIYSGDVVSNLTLLAAGSINSFETAAETTYQISATGTPGDVQLSIVLSNVRIATPADGSRFSTGDAISLVVTNSQIDASFDHVNFYVDGQLLGSASGYPFVFLWTNAVAGDHQIMALAVDSDDRLWDMPTITLAVRPPNDDFANHIVLSGTCVTGTGNDLGSTWEQNDPTGNAWNPSHDIWYQWTPPADGNADFTATGNITAFWIFQGTELTNLVGISSEPWWWYGGQYVSFHAVFGQTYQIAIASFNGEGDLTFNLELHPTPAPSNDNFNSPSLLDGWFGYLASYTTNATLNAGEPLLATNASGQSVWWQWTAPTNGWVSILPKATDFPSAIGVFIGTTLPDLVLVTNGVTTNSLSFLAVAGTTYHIAVDGLDHHSGDISLELAMRPPNDDFETRTPIGNTPAFLTPSPSLFLATAQSGEPILGVGHTVWWTYTASAIGKMTISQSQGVNSVAVGVYVGNSISNLTLVASQSGSFFTTAGTTYQIAVDLTGQSSDPFIGSLQLDFASSYVSITKPLSGLVIGTTFSVEAVVDAAFGPVQRVDFFAFGWLFSSATNPPYVATFSNPVERGQTFSAIATGVSGQTSESPPVSVYVMFPRFTNDNYAERTFIVGTNFTDSGSIQDATAEPGEPNHAGVSANHSVWWTWTAPANGGVIITTKSSFFTAIEVYTGIELTNLTSLIANRGNGNVNFNVVAGRTYQIAVDGWDDTGFLTFQLAFWPPPVNDNFEDRISIAGTNVTVHGTTVGATIDSGEPRMSDDPAYGSIWWSWIAPVTAPVQIDAGMGRVVLLAVSTGTNLSQFTSQEVAGDEFAVRFEAKAGITYQIQVSTYFSGADLTLNIRQGTPANDNFANRIVLRGAPLIIRGNNYLSTREVSEPAPGGSSWSSSVWWSWTAPASGYMTIDYVGGSFVLNTKIGVYCGDALTNLTPDTGWSEYGYPQMHYSVTAGTTYQIQFQGAMGECGDFVLQLDAPSPPDNDLFENRFALAGSSLVVTGTTALASSEPGEQNPNGNSVWWAWEAPADGAIRLSTEGSSMTAPISVFTGTNVANLIQVGRSDNGLLFVPVRGGCNYAVAIETTGGSGPVMFTLDTLAPPINDDFASRIALTGSQVTLTSSNWAATHEPSEASQSIASVWWSWTAPFSGPVSISVQSRDFTPILGVFSGDSLTNLTPVTEITETNVVSFQAKSGTPYSISVDGTIGQMGTFNVDIASTPLRLLKPTNLTSFVNPANIELLAVAANPSEFARVDFFANTNFLGSVNTSPFMFLWTNAAPGLYGIVVVATDFNGVTYATPSVQVALSPPNDLFANRILLSGDVVSFEGTNTCATSEADESLPSGASGKTLWWSWTAPADGLVTSSIKGYFGSDLFFTPTPLNLCKRDIAKPSSIITSLPPESPNRPPDSPISPRQNIVYGPLVAIYAGTNLTNLTLWASNTIPSLFQAGVWCVQPAFAFPVSAGQSYEMSLDGMNGSFGDASVAMVFSPTNPPPPPPLAPSNDSFSKRIALTVEQITTTGTTVSATSEAGEPFHGTGASTRSVWWSWTAPSSGTAQVTVGDNSGVGLFVGVYLGDSVDNLTTVIEAADTATFWATAGVTYQIAVASALDEETAFNLQLTVPPAPPSIASNKSMHLSDNRFAIGIYGVPGQSFMVQGSTNLVDWKTIVIDTLLDDSSIFIDADTNLLQRFYRVLPLDFTGNQ